MRRVPVLLSLLVLTTAACARPAADGGPAAPARPADAFSERAAEVVAAWRAAPGQDAWRTGFVPLEDLTVLADDPGFDDDTKTAFANGWFRSAVALPRATPAPGSIRYVDGGQQAPLVSAAAAYAALDKGDPPPCPRTGRVRPTPAAPPASTGPDTATSRPAPGACIPLTVTRAVLGTVDVRTSRGVAQAPAWLFTVEELSRPVARVAVAPGAVAPVPSIRPAAPDAAAGLVAVQDLTAVRDRTLGYRLGIGACDTDVTALVHETPEAVVLGGSVVTRDGVCTEQLLLEPVEVTLKAPLGARVVLDAVTGAAVPLTRG